MKKISACFFAAALVFSAAFAFTSMSKNTEDAIEENSVSVVQGTIRYQGNVPFQYPCIKTDDGKIYTILAEEKAIQEIRKNSSSLFKFEGKIIPNEPGKLSYKGSKDGYFELRGFEVLEQN